MATDTISNAAFPSPLTPTTPQQNNGEKFAASRRVQNAKDDQQQAIQKKRAAQEDEQRAKERVDKARAVEVKARESVQRALADQQQVARKSIDVVV